MGRVIVKSPEFAAVTMAALDGATLTKSRKILITACGRCENTGMRFSHDRRTVGRNWGGPPVGIEPIYGRITLPTGRWTCKALEPDGTPRVDVPVDYGTAPATVELTPHYQTMWYLLTPAK